jgi:hypothetical protein
MQALRPVFLALAQCSQRGILDTTAVNLKGWVHYGGRWVGTLLHSNVRMRNGSMPCRCG